MNQQENYCFVIQPISDEKYDKRFVDIYEPAILNANITAYRVDQDSTVRDIIQSIEKKLMLPLFALLIFLLIILMFGMNWVMQLLKEKI